ncbi:hypothetical protein [Dactylosporangium sp. NPDC048998]|uniref:hypothetical protein n=1 Tax=Dactylosporangium sp. NPDC048998 TaxID=3363976 RepID=UPI00371F32F4
MPLPPPEATPGEPTGVVAARVARARAAAVARRATQRVTGNHAVPAEALHASLSRYGLTDLGPLRAQLDAGAQVLARAMNVLTIENENLRSQLAKA